MRPSAIPTSCARILGAAALFLVSACTKEVRPASEPSPNAPPVADRYLLHVNESAGTQLGEIVVDPGRKYVTARCFENLAIWSLAADKQMVVNGADQASPAPDGGVYVTAEDNQVHTFDADLKAIQVLPYETIVTREDGLAIGWKRNQPSADVFRYATGQVLSRV